MGGVVKAFLIRNEGGTNVAPVGALGEVDDVVDVPVFPNIRHEAIFILRFERLDLQSVRFWPIRSDEVHGVRGIEQRSENLPTAVH